MWRLGLEQSGETEPARVERHLPQAGCPEVTEPAAFADVPADAYCADAVAWAAANGITSGISENLFNPTGIVNRAQLTVAASGC